MAPKRTRRRCKAEFKAEVVLAALTKRQPLAEFDYDNRPTPSFPFDQTQERFSMWLLKRYGLPWMD